MNKHDLIQKVKALDGISQDERAYLIDLINTKKKYGLVWEDKPEDVEETLRQHLPVLQEVVEKRIISPLTPDGGISFDTPKKTTSQPTLFDNPTLGKTESDEQKAPPSGAGGAVGLGANHTLIEGDNLHALTALTFTHEGRIDVIYIDPPYNTGNKDFKYNDSFVDREDSYRHSKWLSFMDKRLRIAKRLLSDKGVIFISIDDNEQAQLKLLCDEVFMEGNFIAQIIWQKKYAPKSDSKYLSESHDFILFYAKSLPLFTINHLPKTEKQTERYTNKDNDPRGPWKSSDVLRNEFREYAYFPVKLPSGREVYPPSGTSWRYTKEKFAELIADNRIWFGEDGDKRPAYKRFISEVRETIPSTTIWTFEEVGHNDSAKKEIRSVLGEDIFSTPKPSTLIKRMIQISSQKDSTILDFFAGSGTTLHATMALNAEDGGRRQCILVTNNENNICEEVTYERNRRVIEGYTNAKGAWVEGLSGNNLRYYRTATVEREPSLRNKRQLTRLATELLCIKEDCYKPSRQDLSDFGIDRIELDDFNHQSANPLGHGNHKNPVKTMALFEENGKRLLMVYDDAAIDDAVALLKQLIAQDDSLVTKVYVFSNGQYSYTEDFEEVLPHITLCALPDAIYKAYQHVLPKRAAPVRVESLEQD